VSETFLVVPVVTNSASKVHAPSERSWSTEETGDLSGELAQIVPEEDKVALNVELESSRVEIVLLKTELSKANEKALELWLETVSS